MILIQQNSQRKLAILFGVDMKKYDQEIINNLLKESVPKPVDNEYLLEDVMLKIRELQNNIEKIEEEKTKALLVFEEKIEDIQDMIEYFKQVIMCTCDHKNEERFKFEGIGTASKSKGRVSWVITNEEKLREYLNNNLDSAEKSEVYTPREDAIVKKKLDEILDRWEEQDSLPDYVEKKENDPTMKIRFEKEKSDKDVKPEIIDDVEF